MKAIKDLMSRDPSYCEKNDKLEDIICRRLLALEILPVIDEHSCVIGTINLLDLPDLIKENEHCWKDIKATDIMTAHSCTINTYDDEATALQLMRNYHASCLMVVDAGNHLMGRISFITLARRIIMLRHELKHEIPFIM